MPGMTSMPQRLLSWILPAICTVCETDLEPFVQGPVCRSCQKSWCPAPQILKNSLGLDFIMTLGAYDGVMASLVKTGKLGAKEYVVTYVAKIAAQVTPKPSAFELLVPVPMPYWREIWRGFNQAELIAQQLSRAWQIQVETRALRRSGFRRQLSLRRRDRIINAGRSYRLDRKAPAVRGKNILLVDDVVTTGSTLAACARLLKSAGAKKIGAFCLAHDLVRPNEKN